MVPTRAKGSGPNPLSRQRSASSTDLQRDSEALSGDIQTFALPWFNQSTLKRQSAGPKVLYLYLFSLNLQLTVFHANMPHSSLYNFNSASVIFSFKQATQLFTTFTVTCCDPPNTHVCLSGFSHVQTPYCRDGTSRAALPVELSPTAPGIMSCMTLLGCPQQKGCRAAVIWL